MGADARHPCMCAMCAPRLQGWDSLLPCQTWRPAPAEPADRVAAVRHGRRTRCAAHVRVCGFACRLFKPCRRSCSGCWGCAGTILSAQLAWGSVRLMGWSGDPPLDDIAYMPGLLTSHIPRAHSAQSGHRVKSLLAVNIIPCCGARRGHTRAGARGAADAAGRRAGAGLGARAARPVQARGPRHPGHRGCRRAAAGRAGAASGAGETGRALMGFAQVAIVLKQHVPGMPGLCGLLV